MTIVYFKRDQTIRAIYHYILSLGKVNHKDMRSSNIRASTSLFNELTKSGLVDSSLNDSGVFDQLVLGSKFIISADKKLIGRSISIDE